MKIQSKVLAAALLVGIALAWGSSAAYAEENGFVSFWRKVFHWPVKTTENVGNAVGATGSYVGGAGDAMVRNTGATLAGDTSKAGQIVAEPVVKTGQAAGALASGTAGAPIKAYEDVQKEGQTDAQAAAQ